MNHIQKFEKFNFFKKKVPKNIKSELDEFLKKEIEDFGYCDASVREDGRLDGIDISFLTNTLHTFIISKNKSGSYEISKYGINDKIEISDSEFEEYKKKFQEISDKLDKKSEDKKSTVDTDGNLNLNMKDGEIDRMELNNKFNDIFKDEINKSYEFETKYNKDGEKVIDRCNLKIKEIIPMPYFGKEVPSITVDILVEWNKLPYKIRVNEDTKTEYFDLENAKLTERGIMMFYDRSDLTRKQDREFMNDPKKNPILIECSPSKYNSIQFLQKVKEILVLVNSEIGQ